MRFTPLRRRPAHRVGTAALACGLAAASLAPGAFAANDGPQAPIALAQAAGEEPAEEPTAEPEEAAEEAPAAPAPGVEVIRVRGRGIADIATDVPASVTQFDAATIEALGAQDISDLSRVTPNVQIVQPGSTQATFFVRGIGLSDFSSNAAGAVTIFQDDVAINAPAIQTGQLYDIEGVEIVRGPQGTGPFRNASAGAIRVRSRRPTGAYSATLRSSIGRYHTEGDKGARSALIQDYEGALEMPIVGESLSSRFAFRLRQAEPYRTNGCADALPFDQRIPLTPDKSRSTPGISQCGEMSITAIPNDEVSRVPFGLPKYVNDQHNWAARGTLRFRPPDTEMEFFLNLHGSRLDEDSPLGQAIGTVNLGGVQNENQVHFAGTDANGYVDRDVQEEFNELCRNRRMNRILCANQLAQQQLSRRVAADRPLDKRPYRGDYNRVGQTTRDSWGGFLSGEAEIFANTRLFALASYDQYERFQDVDSDFTPESQFEVLQGDEAWQTYHELRLDGELARTPLEWSLGAYYLREVLDSDGTIIVGEADGAFDVRRIYNQTIDSYAVWGAFGWDFADDFTLRGGVRFNRETKEFDFRTILGLSQGSTRELDTWQTPTGQIILTWHMTPDASAYARYTRGFKAGHYNALASKPAFGTEAVFDNPPADEEYNDAWEAGLSGAWLDRRLQLAGSFFYYRYENYQIFLFTDSPNPEEPPTLEIRNAKEAENYGVEIEGTLQPLRGWAPRLVEGLRLSGNFSWLHGEYLDFTTVRKFRSRGGNTIFNAPIDFSGRTLQNAPEYKVSATVEWRFDLGRFGQLSPRYDLSWSDDVFFDPNEGRGTVDPTGFDPALPEYSIGQRNHFLHNLRLAYRTPAGNAEVAAWVRNLEDQVYKNFAFDASRFNRLVINFPGEPRTIGVDLIFTF